MTKRFLFGVILLFILAAAAAPELQPAQNACRSIESPVRMQP